VDGDAPQPLVDALIALMPWAVWTLSRAVRCKQWDIARELIDAQELDGLIVLDFCQNPPTCFF
jgi:hypothetical protein